MSTEDTSAEIPGEVSAEDAALRQERDELHDRLLRVTAEYDNYRKRTDRERREQSEFVTTELVRDLLPVIDDFERALATPFDAKASVEHVKRFHQGVELIHRQL